MDLKIKFFIIIPIYNVESYLHKCLDSVIHQTYKNFEVICVNDGSTDQSLEIARGYADSNPRFTFISQTNQGQSVARNKALDIAKQKWQELGNTERENSYICFLDSDDWWETNTLEYFTEILSNNTSKNIDIIISNQMHVDSQTQQSKNNLLNARLENQIFTSQILINELYNDKTNFILTRIWGGIYSCSFLFKYNIYFIPKILSEDVIFATECVLSADSIYIDSTPLYHYRLSPNSITRNKSLSNLKKHADSYFFITKHFYTLKDSYNEPYKQYLEKVTKWALVRTLNLLQQLGYKNTNFTKKEILKYAHLLEKRRLPSIYFPRLYGFPKRMKQYFKSKSTRK